MHKRIYLYGAGRLYEEALEANAFGDYDIVGIFDGNAESYGGMLGNIPVSKPGYIENSIVCVTNIARTESVMTLLNLGYRKFMVLHEVDGEFVIKDYDYSKYTDFEENPRKVLLLGRNLSGSNIYGLYKAVQNMDLDDIEVEYFCGNLEHDLIYHILTSKVIVVEYDREIFPSGKIVVQLWHGFGPKGSGFRNRLLNDEKIINKMIKKWLGYEIVCSYSDTYSTIISSCYCIPSYKFRITGMPRNDVMLKSTHTFADIFPECEGKYIMLYMPTFRQRPQAAASGDEKGYLYNFDGFDYNIFNEECKKRNVFLIVKHHVFDSRKETVDLSNIKFLTNGMIDIDFYEYLGSADLLITDYSSVFTDYLLMDKPILFVGNDMEKYGEERGFLVEPVETWLPGPVIENYEDFWVKADMLMDNNEFFREKRDIVKRISHRYFDSESGRRVWECILNLMKDEEHDKEI